MTVYEAMDVLHSARHRLSSDVLRSLHGIWICASAARFGEPYEHWTWEENTTLCREHDTAECEAPPPPRKCEGCEQLLADDYRDWFCEDCMTAASEAF